MMTPPAPYEKSKFLGSGGSMVARLKLKGIDGRAPPGVMKATTKLWRRRVAVRAAASGLRVVLSA